MKNYESEDKAQNYAKRPEFVIIEDDRKDEERKKDEEGYFQTILKFREAKFGFLARLLALVLFCFLGLLTLFFSVIFFFCLICKIVTVGQSQSVRELWGRAVKLYGKILLYTFAALVGVISPRTGLSLVLLYHIYHHEKLQTDMFSRMADSDIHFN